MTITMKKNLILALAIIGLSAGRLCGQTNSDIYLIGTSITAPGKFTGFDRINGSEPPLFNSSFSFIIRSLEKEYEIWFCHYNFNLDELKKIRPVGDSDQMQIVTKVTRMLNNYKPIDVTEFISTKTKAEAEAWAKSIEGKKVWIIDRSHGFSSTPFFGKMTLIETRVSLPEVSDPPIFE